MKIKYKVRDSLVENGYGFERFSVNSNRNRFGQVIVCKVKINPTEKTTWDLQVGTKYPIFLE